MRLVTVNRDMPFLVDSVAGAIAARGLGVHRLLHPIVLAERDKAGKLKAIGEGKPESIIYIELDRADARGRQELVRELEQRARRRPRGGPRLAGDARADEVRRRRAGQARQGGRGAAALARGRTISPCSATPTSRPTASVIEARGILKREMALWDRSAARSGDRPSRRRIAHRPDPQVRPHFAGPPPGAARRRHGPPAPTAPCRSTPGCGPAPRCAPRPTKCRCSAPGCASSTPSSASLRQATPARRSPMRFRRLPHDLLISFDEQEVRAAALTAMSLADRPRPKLLLLPGALRRHIYAFVWLPRDELTTARRKAIARMLELEIEATISSWSVELGEGELALLRFTLPVDPAAELPDAGALDAGAGRNGARLGAGGRSRAGHRRRRRRARPAWRSPTCPPFPTAIARAPAPRKPPPTCFGWPTCRARKRAGCACRGSATARASCSSRPIAAAS